MQQNNFLSDDFLFGHDLPLNNKEFNKMLKKNKIKAPNKKELTEMLNCSRSFRMHPLTAESSSGDFRPGTVGQPLHIELQKQINGGIPKP
jgi:hypothetical protein